MKTKPWERDAILKLLADHPTWSNKDIAAQVPGVTANQVKNYRLPAGQRTPTNRSGAAPKTRIDPTPPPSIALDNVADLDEPPAPPPGMEYQPQPEADTRLKLHSGTSTLIDQLVPSLAQIATAVALRVAPERVQPLVPSPQVAEVVLAAPARILARHSHVKVDELSEDGQDIAAMFMALGAWGLEIRANLEARAQYAQAGMNGANNGSQRPNGAGLTTASPSTPSVASPGGAGESIGGIFGGPQPLGTSQGAVSGQGRRNHDGRGSAAAEPDPATGRQLMAGLYTADSDGRRRLGLQ